MSMFRSQPRMSHNNNGTTNGQPQYIRRSSNSRGHVGYPAVSIERDERSRRSYASERRRRSYHNNSPPSSSYGATYGYDDAHAYGQHNGHQHGVRHDLSTSSDRASESSATSTNSSIRRRSRDEPESPIGRSDTDSPMLSAEASPLSPPPNCEGLTIDVGAEHDDDRRIGDSLWPLPSPASLIPPLTPVEPVTPRTSPLKSKRILFLDVDGVLLSAKCQQQMKEGQRIKFNPNMKKWMTRIAHETKCDIVVSSSWQFYEDHLQQLNSFLVECGWSRDCIHTLVDTLGSDITRDKYEQAPYCQSRSRGIMKMIEKHSMSIQNWVAIDDLPLTSTQHVCVPLKDDVNDLSESITSAYMDHIFNYFRDKENIRQWRGHVIERTFHALTVPPHAVFSWKSLLFGFEFTEDTVRVQARTVCNWIAITERIVDMNVVERIVESVKQVIHEYCIQHCGVQGYPGMQDHFVQTDMNTGLTEEDTEKVISVLKGRDCSDARNMFQTIFSPRGTVPPPLGAVAEDERESSPIEKFPENPFQVPRSEMTGSAPDFVKQEVIE